MDTYGECRDIEYPRSGYEMESMAQGEPGRVLAHEAFEGKAPAKAGAKADRRV